MKRNERSERQRKATACRNANHRTPSCLPERCFAPLQCSTLMSNRDVAASSHCNSCLVLLSAFVSAFAPIPVLVSAITCTRTREHYAALVPLLQPQFNFYIYFCLATIFVLRAYIRYLDRRCRHYSLITRLLSIIERPY